MSDTDMYLVGGSGLPTTEPPTGVLNDSYSRVRKFQSDTVAWERYGDEPVSVLAAPTGAGKTAAISAIAADSHKTICLYPTNRLVEEQHRELESFGFTVKRVTSDDLTGHGVERSNQLLEISGRDDYDILVTNPDILQAIVQGLYFSPNDRVVEFFSHFDAAVFDEFHYYDPLAASGLLTQIKLLVDRGTHLDIGQDGVEQKLPSIVLSSASPDQTFINLVEEELGFNTRTIPGSVVSLDITTPNRLHERVDNHVSTTLSYDIQETSSSKQQTTQDLDSVRSGHESLASVVEEAPEHVHRFRYPMLIHRHSSRAQESFDEIATTLLSTVTHTECDELCAGVIFNSAVASNRFHTFIEHEYPELFDVTEKDNGYDTNTESDTSHSDSKVLNTTSKGEVGLDYDLERLVMVSPSTSAGFIQRIGRAARSSPAVIDVYNLDDPGWDPTMSYPEFLRGVLRVLTTNTNPYSVTKELIGIRGAYAVTSRDTVSDGVSRDLSSLPEQSKWRSFFTSMKALHDEVDSSGGFTSLKPSTSLVSVLEAFDSVCRGLGSFRGRSLSNHVAYPGDDGFERTTYGLLRFMQHYRVEAYDDGVFWGRGESPDRVVAWYPGEPCRGDGINLCDGRYRVERELTSGYTSFIDRCNIGLFDVDVDVGLLNWFFDVVPLQDVLLPTRVSTPSVRVVVDERSGVVDSVDFE